MINTGMTMTVVALTTLANYQNSNDGVGAQRHRAPWDLKDPFLG
jgi:hypothetical protein